MAQRIFSIDPVASAAALESAIIALQEKGIDTRALSPLEQKTYAIALWKLERIIATSQITVAVAPPILEEAEAASHISAEVHSEVQRLIEIAQEESLAQSPTIIPRIVAILQRHYTNENLEFIFAITHDSQTDSLIEKMALTNSEILSFFIETALAGPNPADPRDLTSSEPASNPQF